MATTQFHIDKEGRYISGALCKGSLKYNGLGSTAIDTHNTATRREQLHDSLQPIGAA
jgi:hypothetical protein